MMAGEVSSDCNGAAVEGEAMMAMRAEAQVKTFPSVDRIVIDEVGGGVMVTLKG